MRTLLLPLLFTVLAGCEAEPKLGIESATIVANPVPDRPAAGYMVIHGGPSDQYLEYASVPYAGRTELHETVSDGGRMAMRPITRVPVPAGSTVEFKPGGKHLMIFGLSPTAVEQGRTQLMLRFSDGSQASYNAAVRLQGRPAE